MGVPAVSCSSCGRRAEVSASQFGRVFPCASCGRLVYATAPTTVPGLSFGPGDDLEVAVAKTVRSLEDRGAPVHEPREANLQLLSRDFGRLVFVTGDPQPELFYVTPFPWREDRVGTVATDVVQAFRAGGALGTPPAVRILSAHPVPKPIAFLGAETPVARLELAVRAEYVLGEEVPPADMPGLGRTQGAEVLRRCLGRDVRVADLKAGEEIERVTIDLLRPERDPSRAIPEDSYLPQAILAALGAALGEALGTLPGVTSSWLRDERFPFALCLLHRHQATSRTFISNPVGKVFKLYSFGRTEGVGPFIELIRTKLGMGPGE